MLPAEPRAAQDLPFSFVQLKRDHNVSYDTDVNGPGATEGVINQNQPSIR